MFMKFALVIAACLACVNCYSIGESYFQNLAGKAGPTCSDGNCVCNRGETCCKRNNQYQCCKVASGVCCSDSNDCCPFDTPLCTHCTAGKLECCAEEDNKCCGGKCCAYDSFPGCTFGFCIGGKKKRSVPSIPATTLLQPKGPSEKCIEVTLSPESTTRYTGPSTTAGSTTAAASTTTGAPGTSSATMSSSSAMPATSSMAPASSTTATPSMAPASSTTVGGSTTTPPGQQKDCAGWKKAGETANGIYTIITTSGPLQVYCDMTTGGGGWVVFQRRQDGSVNFTQNWDSYASGFGNLNGEFWLGNSHISDISLADTQLMQVELTDCQGNIFYEVYPQFVLNNASTNFTITLTGSSVGTAGDSLAYQCPGHFCQNNMQFSTYDRDNDKVSFGNCAIFQQGAWWYNACGVSDLNGLYYSTCVCTACNPYQTGIYWRTYKGGAGDGYSFKMTEIKIRPATFIP